MVEYFVRHPNAANLMLIAALILGISVVGGMERETFPAFTPSKVTVTVVYPGAGAGDVDEDICLKLDDALSSVASLSELECQSTDARATATLTMTENQDIGQFYNDIFSDVSAIGDLPTDAEEPIVSIAGQDEQIALVAISGIDNSDSLLRYADTLAARIDSLAMISTVEVTGIGEQEFRVTFNPGSLRKYALSASDVKNAIIARSLRQPLGTVETVDGELSLRYSDIRRTIGELEELLIVRDEQGGFVRLRDLAKIRQVSSSPELQSYINGAPAAILRITKTPDDDAIEAFSQVENVLAQERARYPEPFALTITNDSTQNIRDRLDVVLGNTATGLVLVFLIMCLFFPLKEAFWISAALPASFLGGLFVLSIMGVTINMISLIALLMAVGLIMDDSIVIADNISKWRGKVGPKEAAIRGASEVMPGVVSSFLTTACVFTPLMFLSGEIGAVLEVVPVVLLVVLAVSLFEAFFILPNHLSHSTDDHGRQERRIAPRLIEFVKLRFILPVVRLLVAWRYMTLGLTVSALIASVGLMTSGVVKVIGFPATEGDTIEARISLTSGSQLSRTEATIEQLLAALQEIDALYSPNTQSGSPLVERVLVRYATNSDAVANGSNTATITVDLQTSETRNVDADDVLVAWREAAGPLTDLSQLNFAQTAGNPGGSDLDVQLSSRDLETLEAATNALFSKLIDLPEVTTAYQDFGGGRQEVAIVLNTFGYSTGLTPQSLAGQLRSAFAGDETDRFNEGVTELAIQVELGQYIPDLSELERFPIALPDGDQAALLSVADLKIAQSYAQITRQNGEALSRILGAIDLQQVTPAELATSIMNDLAPEISTAFPGVSVAIGGATQAQTETQNSILVALSVGLIGVYLLLAFQFRSYTLPIVVMLSIPFAIIGVILGHLLLGINLAMPSFVGFASLAGIVVNNAILFLTFFEAETDGDDYLSGAVEAVSHRFRPILLSFSTTFVGLLPIIFETSPQAATMVPLVSAVAFGLLSSTLLVIFVLPATIAIYFDMVSVAKWKSTANYTSEKTEG